MFFKKLTTQIKTIQNERDAAYDYIDRLLYQIDDLEKINKILYTGYKKKTEEFIDFLKQQNKHENKILKKLESLF